MRPLTSLTTLLALTTAAHAAARKYYPDQLIAITKDNEQINEMPVNAIHGYFRIAYTGRDHARQAHPPTTSCPQQKRDGGECPPGDATAIIYSRDQAALDAEVPGGQYVIVDRNGFLGYTAPMAGIIPRNATATGFFVKGPAGGESRGTFNFKGMTAKGKAEGFVACPSSDEGPPYTVMVDYDKFFTAYGPHRRCTKIQLALTRYGSSKAAAWQRPRMPQTYHPRSYSQT
ncbi:hypothetical protein ANO11243_002330 [Dothideomycetidae sp. 11243]|nr:hypothetical protein ANO11243_002330 [fungal sp. No.11243]